MILDTLRTTMIKYKKSDLDAFFKVICNDEVMLFISGKGNSKEVAKEKFETILLTNKENEYYGVYKVIHSQTNKLMGFAKIVPFENNYLEIGYALLPPYWRKGYTLEMIEKMTAHCQEFFPNKKLMAIVNNENVGSIRILEKCNYKEYQQKVFKGVPCMFFEYSD